MSRLTAESRAQKRFDREFRRVRRQHRKTPQIDITDDLNRHLPTYLTPITVGEYPARLKSRNLFMKIFSQLFGRFGKRDGRFGKRVA